MRRDTIHSDCIYTKRGAGWMASLIRFLFPTALAAALILSSCTRSVQKEGPVSGTAVPAPGSIAYSGTDGNIYVIDAAGGTIHQVTQNAKSSTDRDTEYLYPAWSFDGQRLAYVGYSPQKDGRIESTLYVSDRKGKRPSPILKSMDISPFYLYWSPDSNSISFLSSSSSRDDLVMQIIKVEGGNPVAVEAGQPLYWSWRMDSNTILTHSGGSALEQPDKAVIKLYDLTSEDREGTTLNYFPALFQAPEQSPDGEALLIAAEMYRRQSTLVLASSDGEPRQLITDWRGPLSFSWSPVGDRIAYITGVMSPIGGIIGTLYILGMAEDTEKISYEVPAKVFTYFWSPDGSKIALFEPAIVPVPSEKQMLLLNVSILDVESGEVKSLLSVRPTRAFLGQVVPFFDQYQRSHTIWSPDSTHIVVNGVTGDDRPGIFVVPVEDGGTPQLLAYGIFPFWSWR